MTTWHVDEDILTGWIDGDVTAVYAASVEQHLLHCAHCRGRVDNRVKQAPLVDMDAIWTGIADRVEVPAISRFERVLRRVGLSDTDAMLVASAPALRGAWGIGAMAALLFVLAAAAWGNARGMAWFLMLAPLVPVASVALAYDAQTDPALEQEAAAPYPALRLVLLRTLAVLAVCMPALFLAGFVLPDRVTFLWLVPAAAFAAVVLALSTWMEPSRPAAAIAVLWIVVVGTWARRGDVQTVLTPGYLVAYAVLGAAAVLVLTLRGRHFDQLRGI